MRKRILQILGGLVGLLVLIQLVPVTKTNPPAQAPLSAPPAVMTILKNSCYDCHSNETTWPWYSNIAPISWLVAHDVKEGREELNFSNWGKYSKRRKRHKLKEIQEEIEENKMPMKLYLITHPKASLSTAQKQLLFQWVKQQRLLLKN